MKDESRVNQDMNFDAVILAGGNSRRMGRDKAWLPLDGQPLLARQIAMVRQLSPAEIFISGRADTDYGSLGCRVLRDGFPDAGPLAGIAAALEAASAPWLLVLAVDLPRVTADLLHILLRRRGCGVGVVPRVNRAVEPLVAVYPKAAGPIAADLLTRQVRAARAFVGQCRQAALVAFLDVAESDWSCFANWNHPGDVNPSRLSTPDLAAGQGTNAPANTSLTP